MCEKCLYVTHKLEFYYLDHPVY